jgi:hypothetical protein
LSVSWLEGGSARNRLAASICTMSSNTASVNFPCVRRPLVSQGFAANPAPCALCDDLTSA